MLKFFNELLNALLVVGIIFSSGCSEQENKNVAFMSSAKQVHNNEGDYVGLTEKEAKEIGISVGLKNKELLSAISGVDEPAVLVNGIPITNRTICYQKALQLYPGMRTLKEEIISIIRTKAVQSEAVKKGIEPSQATIDAYLQEELNTLKNGTFGLDFELGYIEGMDITIEEYVKSRKQMIYDMFQRNAFWDSLQPMKKSREEYIDDLVKKAKIEILDTEIKQLFQ